MEKDIQTLSEQELHGNMTIKEIKSLSKQNLKGNWTEAVLFTLVYGLLLGVIGTVASFTLGIVYLLVAGPFILGLHIFFYKIANNAEEAEVSDVFGGFKHFFNAIVLSIVQDIFIFLWSLLLIVPGIIKAFAYSMTYFVYLDDPTLSTTECISKSQELMKGHKWQYFVLNLSFIGWALLCLLTLGIGFLWLDSYINTAKANFYKMLKGDFDKNEENVTETENKSKGDDIDHMIEADLILDD